MSLEITYYANDRNQNIYGQPISSETRTASASSAQSAATPSNAVGYPHRIDGQQPLRIWGEPDRDGDCRRQRALHRHWRCDRHSGDRRQQARGHHRHLTTDDPVTGQPDWDRKREGFEGEIQRRVGRARIGQVAVLRRPDDWNGGKEARLSWFVLP
jgi:hypothetical protein